MRNPDYIKAVDNSDYITDFPGEINAIGLCPQWTVRLADQLYHSLPQFTTVYHSLPQITTVHHTRTTHRSRNLVGENKDCWHQLLPAAAADIGSRIAPTDIRDKLSPAPCEYHWIICTIKLQNYGRHVSGGAHSEAPQAAVLAHSFCFSVRRVVSAKTFRIQTALSCMLPPPPACA